MSKESLEKRLTELKEANDKENNQLNELDEYRQKLIQNMLVRNGRILELVELLKELEENK